MYLRNEFIGAIHTENHGTRARRLQNSPVFGTDGHTIRKAFQVNVAAAVIDDKFDALAIILAVFHGAFAAQAGRVCGRACIWRRHRQKISAQVRLRRRVDEIRLQLRKQRHVTTVAHNRHFGRAEEAGVDVHTQRRTRGKYRGKTAQDVAVNAAHRRKIQKRQRRARCDQVHKVRGADIMTAMEEQGSQAGPQRLCLPAEGAAVVAATTSS